METSREKIEEFRSQAVRGVADLAEWAQGLLRDLTAANAEADRLREHANQWFEAAAAKQTEVERLRAARPDEALVAEVRERAQHACMGHVEKCTCWCCQLWRPLRDLLAAIDAPAPEEPEGYCDCPEWVFYGGRYECHEDGFAWSEQPGAECGRCHKPLPPAPEEPAPEEPLDTPGSGSLYRKRPIIVRAMQCCERREIETLEGTMVAEPGDWIITGINGERYPCKPDIFAATYEWVEPDAPAPEVRQFRLVVDGAGGEEGRFAVLVAVHGQDAPMLATCIVPLDAAATEVRDE